MQTGVLTMAVLLTALLPSTSSSLSGLHRYRLARRRFAIEGQVQIHHIIPRQCRTHPSLREFEVHGFSNLMFVPSTPSMTRMRVRPCRISRHDGGHALYNEYVRKRLDDGAVVDDLVKELRSRIRTGCVPWSKRSDIRSDCSESCELD